MITYSIIQKSHLEGALRLDADLIQKFHEARQKAKELLAKAKPQ